MTRNFRTLFTLTVCLLSTPAMSAQESLDCGDFTLSNVLRWSACELTETVNEEAKSALRTQADNLKRDVALKLLGAWIGGGNAAGLFELFGGGIGGGDSQSDELRAMTEQILEAIKISQEETIEAINNIFIARDFANLDSFKLQVRSYMLDSDEVRLNNINQLQHLWNTSVELSHIFETHLDNFNTSERVDSFHSYLAIVGLELMLRAQLTSFDYHLSGQEELIEQQVLAHYQNELTGVFQVIDNLDWRAAAEGFFSSTSVNDSDLSAYHHRTIYSYRFLGELIKIEWLFDAFGGFSIKVLEGDLSWEGLETGKAYTVTDINLNGSFLVSQIMNHSSVKNSRLHPNRIKARHIQRAHENLVLEGYFPIRSVLDDWRELAQMPPRETLEVDEYLKQRGMHYENIILSESFESGDGVSWYNTGDHNWWFGFSNGTPSNHTGPNKASDGSVFRYLETSRNGAYYNGDNSILESHFFEASDGFTLKFDVHMYGADIGTLYIDYFDTTTQSWKNSATLNGQWQKSSEENWLSIGLPQIPSTGNTKIRFRAEAKGGWKGDIAIDNLRVFTNGKVL